MDELKLKYQKLVGHFLCNQVFANSGFIITTEKDGWKAYFVSFTFTHSFRLLKHQQFLTGAVLLKNTVLKTVLINCWLKKCLH